LAASKNSANQHYDYLDCKIKQKISLAAALLNWKKITTTTNKTGKKSYDIGILSVQYALTLRKPSLCGSKTKEFQNNLFCHFTGLKSELRQAAQILKVMVLSVCA